MDRPLLDVEVERWGALGLKEIEDRRQGVTDEQALAFVKKQLDTMTPLDRAVIEIRRREP